MSNQWWLCAIQNVAIVKISFSCDQRLLQQTTKITPMYLLHTHSTKKKKNSVTTTNNQNHTNVLTSHSFNQKNKNVVQYQMKIPLP